jgi:hypothetical protein
MYKILIIWIEISLIIMKDMYKQNWWNTKQYILYDIKSTEGKKKQKNPIKI